MCVCVCVCVTNCKQCVKFVCEYVCVCVWVRLCHVGLMQCVNLCVSECVYQTGGGLGTLMY